MNGGGSRGRSVQGAAGGGAARCVIFGVQAATALAVVMNPLMYEKIATRVESTDWGKPVAPSACLNPAAQQRGGQSRAGYLRYPMGRRKAVMIAASTAFGAGGAAP